MSIAITTASNGPRTPRPLSPVTDFRVSHFLSLLQSEPFPYSACFHPLREAGTIYKTFWNALLVT